MNTYAITAPNGKKYKVTGETPEGAMAALRKMLGQSPENASQDVITPPPVEAQGKPTPEPVDTWTDTASAMTEGPWAAAKRFGSALVSGGEGSPSLSAIASDPVLGKLPVPLQSALGFGGDIGGAALSTLGAGLSGAIGLATELVPGQSPRDEARLGGDLLDMSMFAAPEMAGVSTGLGRAAKVAAPEVATPIAGDVAAARARGIPVYRTDVTPPETFLGKTARKIGENIPIAGTGEMRAGQQTARVDAVKGLVREFDADIPEAAINDVAASVLEKHSATLREFGGKKTAIVNSVKGRGAVPVPNATAEITRQIDALKAQRLPELEPVIKKLEGWRDGLAGQPLDVLEKNRQDLGAMFKDPSLAGVRDRGEKAISAIYDPLRKDIAAFVKAEAGDDALAVWNEANGRIAAAMGEAKTDGLRRVLNKGEATPEVVRTMLFSQKPSDVGRLYKSLTPEGQAAGRTAILQEAVAKSGGIENLSPDKFAAALNKMGPQIGTFISAEDRVAVEGLRRALALTRHAAEAKVFVPTGVQNFAASLGVGGAVLGQSIGAAKTLGGTVAVGLAARAYEATGVQRALKLMAKAEGQKSQAIVLKQLDEALQASGMAASVSGQAANTPYEGLMRRYGK